MKTEKYFFVVFISIMLTGISCEKLFGEEEDDPFDCTRMTAPVVTVNTTVQSGNALSFTLARVEAGSSYFWTGPNGFTSTMANLEIPQVLSSHAGVYSIEEVTAWGCRRTTTTDPIVVTMPAPPCTPSNNTANIDGVGNMTFSPATGAPSGGSYFLEAHGQNGDIELEFPGTSRPVAGVYAVRDLGSQWKTGDVRVRLVSQSSNWPASSGKLYLTVTANKLKAVFCSLPVSGQTWGVSSTASGSIMEQ